MLVHLICLMLEAKFTEDSLLRSISTVMHGKSINSFFNDRNISAEYYEV